MSVRRFTAATVSFFLFFIFSNSAYALVIDFEHLIDEEYAVPGTIPGGERKESSYNVIFKPSGSTGGDSYSIVEGYRFTDTDQHSYERTSFNLDSGSKTYNNTDILIAANSTNILAVRPEDNSLFDLLGIDLTNWSDFTAQSIIIVTGTRNNGSTVEADLMLDNVKNSNDQDGNDFNHYDRSTLIPPSSNTYYFTNFNGLTQFTISGGTGAGGYIAIDNIEVRPAQIPAPATLALMGLGLLGLGLSRRNRKAF